MKQRTTLTLDPKVSHRAKLIARQRGISLSAMIENFLAKEIEDASGPSEQAQTFSQRWAGTMKLSETEDLRSERLKQKYGL